MGLAPGFVRRRDAVPPPAYGCFQIYTPEALTAVANAGLTHVLVQARWDQMQPAGPGTPLDTTALSTMLNLIRQARERGLHITLEVAIHYIAPWAADAIPKFRNQSGGEWSEDTEAGRNIRDWVFTQVGRDYVADFYNRVLSAVDMSQIQQLRLGGGYYNESHFVPTGYATWNGVGSIEDIHFDWYAFGTAAQTGVGLAAGMVACPVPGHIPFTAGQSTATAAYKEWWYDAFGRFILWQIDVVRKHFDGRIYVMHPSFGRREATSVGSVADKSDLAEGTDWPRHMAMYAHMPRVIPHSTWVDGIHPYGSDLTVDSNTAGWYQLRRLAAIHGGKEKFVSGENTTPSWGTLDIDRVFQLDAMASGYNGFHALNYEGLTSGIAGQASLARYAANIAYKRGTGPKPPVPAVTTVQGHNIALWVQPESLVTSGSVITGWQDSSGLARHATSQSTTARRPQLMTDGLGGLPYARFDGVDDFLVFPEAPFDLAAYTIFMLARMRPGGVGIFMGKSGGTYATDQFRKLEIGMTASGQFWHRAGQDSDYTEFYTPNSLRDQWQLFCVQFRTGDDFDLVVNGANQVRSNLHFKSTPYNDSALYLGRAGESDGDYGPVDIAEAIVCSQAVTVPVRQQIETYFRLKYRLF